MGFVARFAKVTTEPLGALGSSLASSSPASLPRGPPLSPGPGPQPCGGSPWEQRPRASDGPPTPDGTKRCQIAVTPPSASTRRLVASAGPLSPAAQPRARTTVRHASRARDPGVVGEFCLDKGDLQVPQPGPGRTPGTSDVRARVAERAVGGKETSGRRAAGWEGALQTPTPACTRRSPGKVVGPRREEIMSDRVWRRSINRMSSDNSGESLARAVEGGPRKPPGCRPCSSVSRGTCGRVPASLPGLRARGPRKAGPPT